MGHIVRRSKPEACHLKPFRGKGCSADQEIHRPHPGHGLPWQKGANTYIAGHRLGYEGTSSYPIFYYLDQLVEGDEILLEDSAGATYTYRVTDQMIVDPDNVEVMEPVDGKSLVSLRTCTLPDYEQRLIVQGELVDKST